MPTRHPDDTDLEILRLLAENARRPYCEIAEQVNLSAPAVSDRVAKLSEFGIIRRFTLDIDRSQLFEAIPVLVVVHPSPAAVSSLRDSLLEATDVEHVFTTADAELVFTAMLRDTNVGEWLQANLEMDHIQAYDVRLLSTIDWSRHLSGTDFGLTCAECGNRVGPDGRSERVGGTLQQFCCSSCETRYTARYEQHKRKVEA